MKHSLAALVAVGVLLACIGGADAGRASTQLQVAILVPSTGDFAPQNTLMANGAKIAAEESGTTNPVGPLKIALRTAPLAPGADPTSVMKGLAESGDHVVVLPCDVDAVPALAKAGAKAGMLMLLPCDPDPNIVSSASMVWPTGMAGNQEVAQLVNYAHAANAKTAFIVTAKGPQYLATMTRYFAEAAKLDGVRIVGVGTAALDGSNVATLAHKIKMLNPDAIFTTVFSPYGSPIVAGLRKHGVNVPPIFATDGMDGDLGLSSFGSDLNGLNVGSFGFPQSQNIEFLSNYAAVYRHKPDGSFPGLGYETLRILEAAAAHAGSTSPAALDAAFSKGFTLPGLALGVVTYPGKGGHIPLTLSGMARIVNGQHVAMFASDATQGTLIPAP
jgi:ABC-type branched-subunit amino acid transport system substrate-binding protein